MYENEILTSFFILFLNIMDIYSSRSLSLCFYLHVWRHITRWTFFQDKKNYVMEMLL